jgi:hypothetical protein
MKMSKERYNEIIDMVYRDYEVDTSLGNCAALNPQAIVEGWAPDLIDELSKEEFINKCKTDQEFSEKWGLKIEERELSLEERVNLLNDSGLIPTSKLMQSIVEPILSEHNISTKLITITHQNESIQFYE